MSEKEPTESRDITSSSTDFEGTKPPALTEASQVELARELSALPLRGDTVNGLFDGKIVDALVGDHKIDETTGELMIIATSKETGVSRWASFRAFSPEIQALMEAGKAKIVGRETLSLLDIKEPDAQTPSVTELPPIKSDKTPYMAEVQENRIANDGQEKPEQQKQALFERIDTVRNSLTFKLASFADQLRYRQDQESEGKTKVELVRDIFVTVSHEFDNRVINVDEASRKLDSALRLLETDIMAVRSPFGRTELGQTMSGEAARQYGDKKIIDLNRTADELVKVLSVAEGDFGDLQRLTNQFIVSTRLELSAALNAARQRGQSQPFSSAIEFAISTINKGMMNADYDLRLRVKNIQDNLPDLGK